MSLLTSNMTLNLLVTEAWWLQRLPWWPCACSSTAPVNVGPSWWLRRLGNSPVGQGMWWKHHKKHIKHKVFAVCVMFLLVNCCFIVMLSFWFPWFCSIYLEILSGHKQICSNKNERYMVQKEKVYMGSWKVTGVRGSLYQHPAWCLSCTTGFVLWTPRGPGLLCVAGGNPSDAAGWSCYFQSQTAESQSQFQAPESGCWLYKHTFIQLICSFWPLTVVILWGRSCVNQGLYQWCALLNLG